MVAEAMPTYAPGRARWRREWDSNPRYALTYTRFPSVRLKPLGHLSVRYAYTHRKRCYLRGIPKEAMPTNAGRRAAWRRGGDSNPRYP